MPQVGTFLTRKPLGYIQEVAKKTCRKYYNNLGFYDNLLLL